MGDLWWHLSMVYKFPFPTKRLDSSYCHQVVAGAVGCLSSYVGCLVLSLTQFARHSPFPYPGVNFFIGAIIFGWWPSYLHQGNSIIKSGTAIGITFSSFLALGVILISVAKVRRTPLPYPFGNILAVQDTDMDPVKLLGHWFSWLSGFSLKQLLITSFDRLLAKKPWECRQFLPICSWCSWPLCQSPPCKKCWTYSYRSHVDHPSHDNLYANKPKSMIFLSSTLGQPLFWDSLSAIASISPAGSSIVLIRQLLSISFFISLNNDTWNWNNKIIK